MGYIVHTAVIVTDYDEKRIEKAKSFAEQLGLSCSAVYSSKCNSYLSFMTIPDGSKSGWAPHEQADKARDEFMKWLPKEHYEWGYIIYGHDLD